MTTLSDTLSRLSALADAADWPIANTRRDRATWAAQQVAFREACRPALIKALVEAVRAAEVFEPLLAAVLDIWSHTEQHTTYVDGVGYTSRSDQQACDDFEEHSRLAAAEGKAWHDLNFPGVRICELSARLHAVEEAIR